MLPIVKPSKTVVVALKGAAAAKVRMELTQKMKETVRQKDFERRMETEMHLVTGKQKVIEMH